MVLSTDSSLATLASKLPDSLSVPATKALVQLAAALPSWAAPHLNLAAVSALSYLLYYFILDPISATLITPLWFAYYRISWYIAHDVEGGFRLALICFTVSWILQFYGHGVHEGRAPALLDNLLGAVVLAPLFVFIETLFLFGYRPELQKWLKNETARLIVKFRAENPSKRA